MNTQDVGKIHALYRMVNTVAQRDLGLLSMIEETIDALSDDKSIMDIITEATYREIDRVKEYPSVIDADGSILERLERSRDNVGRVHDLLKEKCEVARVAPELREEDGVVDAYCEVISSAAALHNALNDLCWAIGEHDADFDEPTGKKYSNVDEMFADMGL